MVFSHLSPESYTNPFFRREVFSQTDFLVLSPVSISQQSRLCSCSRGISEGWADPRRCSRRGLRFSPHGNNLESFPACVASLSRVLPSFSLPSGGRQSFNAFMFEKHFEVLEEGATEERSVITQINCFYFAWSHSCECWLCPVEAA